MTDDSPQPEAAPPPSEDPRLETYKDGVRTLNWFVTPVPLFKEEELEAMFEPYPLTQPADDQRWVLWTVRIWVGFTLFSIAFILALLVAGFFYGGR
ncbi:MAG TPA: hypothetical protein PLE19_21045 [Planctomycetota bacterium]|nr:hypothetical protein [Planctomycetota bacterium]HRR79873.1 hypothetical protein [Planctomycetota bacterium]HRT96520.1 hypothetical protein [Planctomycetota bacterium]